METPFVCWRSGLKAWQMILLVDVVCAPKQCNSAVDSKPRLCPLSLTSLSNLPGALIEASERGGITIVYRRRKSLDPSLRDNP